MGFLGSDRRAVWGKNLLDILKGLPREVRLTVITDACHSERIVDLPYYFSWQRGNTALNNEQWAAQPDGLKPASIGREIVPFTVLLFVYVVVFFFFPIAKSIFNRV